MSNLRQETERLFFGASPAERDDKRSSRLVQPVKAQGKPELKRFPKSAKDLFVIGWQLDSSVSMKAFWLSGEDHMAYQYNIAEYETTALHTHDYLELGYVVSGQFRQNIRKKEVVFTEGDFCLIDRNCFHNDLLEGKATVLFFGISNRLFDTLFLTDPSERAGEQSSGNVLQDFLRKALVSQKETNQYLVFHADTALPETRDQAQAVLIQLLHELQGRQPGTEYITFGLLLRLMRLLSGGYEFTLTREQDRKRAELTGDAVLQYIYDHYADIHIADLVNEFHYNEDYFNRLILKREGKTYSAFLQDLRLTKAAELLTTTNQTVDDIVAAVGYHNKGYFYKIFQEKYRATPSQYRAAAL